MNAVAHAESHAHAPHRNYVKIWGILTVLLVISVTGPMLGIRTVTLVTAFGVALVKAYLVAKNFMHLDIERPIVHFMLAVVLTLMVLLYAGLAPDVQKSEGSHWRKSAGFHYMSQQAKGEAAPESEHAGGPDRT
jgi:caa(3)-type oxidase subunit IV